MFTENKKEKGFTLLYAVLVSSLVLAIGVSIMSIAFKQLILSSTGRESQYAFYNANSGTECALFYDFNSDFFSTSTPRDNFFSTTNEHCMKSNFYGLNVNSLVANGANFETENDYGVTTFYLKPADMCNGLNDPNDYIVKIVLKKNIDANGLVSTILESRGYNTCDSSNPRRVERGLRVTY